jgi:prepilin-type N-terminal cleavage/methylation domain-containing protein
MRVSDQKGFTLLELLVSTTILAVIITVIVEAFWLGYRSWEKGSDVMEHELRLRTAVGLVSKQLRSTFPFVSDEKEIAFSGGSESISFVTTMPMGLERRSGLFLIEYFLDEESAGGKTMKVRQRPVYATPGMGREENGFTVLPGLATASWAYFSDDEWVDEWEVEDGPLPEKVRLTLRYRKKDREEIHETVIPLLVWEEKARVRQIRRSL